MIVTLRNFYVLNQILLGRDLKAMDEEFLLGLDVAELDKRIKTIKKNNTGESLSELEKVLLNFLRTPEYSAANVNGANVPLSKIAELCRKDGLAPESCAGWLAKCIGAVEDVPYMAPITFADGVLQVPSQLCDDNVIKQAVNSAFGLFVWGVRKPDKKQKALVNRLISLTSPAGSFAMKNTDLVEIVTAIADSGLSVDMLTTTVLNIPDLQPVFKLTGMLLWEDGSSLESVRILVPKGKQDRAWATSVRLKDLLTLANDKLENLRYVTSKGEYLTMTEVGA